MTRKDFFKSAGLGAMAMAASPLAANSKKGDGVFVHDPQDYAYVPEEPEEFQEYEVCVPEDWSEEDIVWV